jgi:hypothetical protein
MTFHGAGRIQSKKLIKLWGRMPELAASVANARAQGQDVQANVYPYRAGQNNISSIIPPWAHEGGAEALIKRLKDPALRQRLESEINRGIPGSNWYNHCTAACPRSHLTGVSPGFFTRSQALCRPRNCLGSGGGVARHATCRSCPRDANVMGYDEGSG